MKRPASVTSIDHDPDQSSSTSPRLLYDRKGAARQLSISVSALDILTANKQLSTIRLGKKIMYRREELARFARMNHPEPMRQQRPKNTVQSAA